MTDVRSSSEYEQARHRAQKKRRFRGDVQVFLVFSALLVGVWAITGAGYFWPAWVIGFWGAGLLLSAWDVFYRRDVTDEEIQRELRRTS